jgi:iron complex outermembrane receptor protein
MSLSHYPVTLRTGSRHRSLSRAVAVALALSAGSGLAQDVGEVEVSPKKGGYSLALEEVVVTAQKREQDTMSVPISVSSFTAQDMVNTGALNVQDIDDFMPGVEITDTSGGATQVGITIRGITSPNISSGGDPSVATFYDNAYMPRAASSVPFTDIARTEVLKGPQGTLFGRNASAGVINIVANKPVDEFEGFVKSRIGNYGLFRAEGMLNVPVTDNIAARANLFYHERDGIIDNVAVGDDIREEGYNAGRLAVMFNLSDDTRIQLAGDYEDRNESPQYDIGVSKYAFSTDPYNSKAANDAQQREENRDMWGASVQLDHDFNDAWSMFGIVSYRDWDTWNIQDNDGTADPRRYIDSNNIEDSDIWYSEFRFNYVADQLNLVTGANYSVEDVYQRTDIRLTADSWMQFVTSDSSQGLGLSLDDHIWNLFPVPPFTEEFYLNQSVANGVAVLPPRFAGQLQSEIMDNTGDFTNWGIFADGTYDLTGTIRVSAGLRYSYDEKEYSWQTFPSDVDWPVPPARIAYDPAQTGTPEEQWLDKFEDDDDWDKVTGRLVFDWQFTDTAMTYLSYATGYKSGGWDGQVFSSWADGSYNPEEVTSIELGLKGDFFDNRLRVETAVFYYELDSQAISEDAKQSPDDPTAQPTIITQDVDADGFEVVLQWQALDSLLLTGMTTVRDEEKTPEAYFDSQGNPAGGRKENVSTDTDYTLRLDWTPDIPVGYLLVHVDYIFNEAEDESGEVIFTTGQWYFQDRELLNARIAWQDDSDTFEVALWGKNLLDKEIADNPDGFVADALGAYRTSIEDPLTWGVDLRYSF